MLLKSKKYKLNLDFQYQEQPIDNSQVIFSMI